MDELGKYVERLQTTDITNMKTVKQKLRYLKNSAESCRTIPKDFRGHYFYTFILYNSVLAHPVAGVCEEQGQILATSNTITDYEAIKLYFITVLNL